MSRGDKEFDLVKGMLNQTRNFKVIKESENSNNKDTAIAITNDARFGQNVLQNQIDAFKKAVNLGAKFSKENSDDPESSPLVYFPKTGNLVFSGSIPSLSNLKFQFSLNDVTNAPYIFVDGLAVTKEVISTFNKLNGYYKNWCEEWLASGDLLDKLKKEDN